MFGSTDYGLCYGKELKGLFGVLFLFNDFLHKYIMIKVEFSFDTQYGVFRDALHLPDDHGYSDVEIDAMKQERVDNWIAIVKPLVDEVI